MDSVEKAQEVAIKITGIKFLYTFSWRWGHDFHKFLFSSCTLKN